MRLYKDINNWIESTLQIEINTITFKTKNPEIHYKIDA